METFQKITKCTIKYKSMIIMGHVSLPRFPNTRTSRYQRVQRTRHSLQADASSTKNFKLKNVCKLETAWGRSVRGGAGSESADSVGAKETEDCGLTTGGNMPLSPSFIFFFFRFTGGVGGRRLSVTNIGRFCLHQGHTAR